MRTLLKYIPIFVLALHGSSAVAQAPSAPGRTQSPGMIAASSSASLEETEAFIKKYIELENNVRYTVYLPNGRVSASDEYSENINWLNKCTMHDVATRRSNSYKSDVDISTIEKIEILRAADIFVQTLDGIRVQPRFDPDYYLIKISYDDNGSRKVDSIYFVDHNNAVRVANAFGHAVALCGGNRKEPF